MSKIKVITINLYKKNKIKLDDILLNKNIDSETFNSFMYGKGWRPLNIPCQVNSDRRNPITPELKF